MKILHLVSFDRWTGAAAPAFAEVEALRAADIDAHYAYVGGSGLEEKIGHLPFTHPIVRREQDPWTIARTTAAIRRLIVAGAFDLVHTHLTHDHWLGRLACRGLARVRLVRTFHSKRTLRRDPVTRWLLRGSAGVCVNNAAYLHAAAIAHRHPRFTPPPVDAALFRPGPGVREAYGIARGTPLLGFIGKVDRGRGFEAAIEVYAHVRRARPATRLLIIGRGPRRPFLEQLAERLGVADGVVWAGYHEEDLVAHLQTPDLMMFTAPGSDEGHRAIVEAMACGTPVAAYPLAGVAELYGPLADRLVAPEASVAALAALCERVFAGTIRVEARECVEATTPSHYPATARRLASFYRSLLAGGGEALG